MTITTATVPLNQALTPVDTADRVFRWNEHASLWFSLGVGLLVIQIGAYLVPAVGTRDAALAIVVGIVLGLVFHPSVPEVIQPYLPIAVIAALDAVFGGVRAVLDGIFVDKVFVVSFLSNVLVAAFIVFLGDQLGVGSQLSTGVVVVLGIRIFSNVAAIRRHLFKA